MLPFTNIISHYQEPPPPPPKPPPENPPPKLAEEDPELGDAPTNELLNIFKCELKIAALKAETLPFPEYQSGFPI